ncbi:MAG TPA: thymidine kinase [Cyclobacteriaceae bacterium]
MFVERGFGTQGGKLKSGWIEVITGCMFSGKTEELIRRINRALIARQKVKIVKPHIDQRYHPTHVVSHNEKTIDSIAMTSPGDILDLAKDFEVIAIDEAQFFDEDIVAACNQLANEGKRVIVAGLDMDFEGKPFGPMPNLMAVAEYVTKLHAICAKTGDLASFSFRLTTDAGKVKLGSEDTYEARSRSSFVEEMNLGKKK